MIKEVTLYYDYYGKESAKFVSAEKYEELKARIGRAIEYIEMIQYNESYGVKEENYNELLDILSYEENS